MLIKYHDIGEDIDSIIKAADTSGPVVLCDSSILLMIHLLHAKVTEAPGSSLVASQNVIRWLIARWNPGMAIHVLSYFYANILQADRSFAAYHAIHVQPCHVIALLRTCLGLHRLPCQQTNTLPCGSVAQAWQHHLNTREMIRYLLLLDSPTLMKEWICPSCPSISRSANGSTHLKHHALPLYEKANSGASPAKM
jgi:ataxia telangiectasia mutated family protein